MMLERFMAKISPEPNSGCWLWDGSLNTSGYGKMSVKNKTTNAHRISWTLFRGPIPEGMQFLHKCDVRCCNNPDHLFLGTVRDNMDDRNAKHRNLYREDHPRAKLTNSAVDDIRSSSATNTILARKYGVSRKTVLNVRQRKIWQ